MFPSDPEGSWCKSLVARTNPLLRSAIFHILRALGGILRDSWHVQCMPNFARPGTLVAAFALVVSPAAADFSRNIMITGYWPQTNNMMRRFSANPAQNPDGWIGQNWEGRGYNIYAFFPEFPGQNGPNWGRGEGDFEVDYQDTSADWWRITSEVDPVAIMTFSRGNNDMSWEVESRNRNRTNWTPDYDAPFTPDSPPDPTFTPNGYRDSSLPMQDIVDSVRAAGLGLNAYIDRSAAAGGTFLSEYIGYHGLWYQSIHSDPNDEAWCVAAGHVHVGIRVDVETATRAMEISLRELIERVDATVPNPGTAGLLMIGGLVAGRRRRL